MLSENAGNFIYESNSESRGGINSYSAVIYACTQFNEVKGC